MARWRPNDGTRPASRSVVIGAWHRLADWSDAVDPGAIRRHNGARASLAALAAWFVVRGATRLVEGEVLGGPALFGVVVCFIGSIAIADRRRSARLIGLSLAAAVAVAGVAVTAALSDHPVARHAMLLALMFASFASRRFGLRPGELALVATTIVYFAGAAGVRPDGVGWYLTATLIGFASVIAAHAVSYDPRRMLQSALRAYERRVADVIASVLESANRSESSSSNDVVKRLTMMGATRRVLENQLPAAASRDTADDRLVLLQLAIRSIEQGATMLVEGCDALARLTPIDEGITDALRDGLGELAESLRGNPPSLDLGQSGARLAALRERAAEVARTDVDNLDWAAPTLEIARGAQSVARSAAQVRHLIEAPGPNRADITAATTPPAVTSADATRRPHPTTVFGLQAVVAALLAAAVGRLAGLEHVSWTYWTAFVVVAGSAGESTRRMALRVTGTTCGAAAGAVVALALPDRTWAVATVVIVGIFMAVFESSISYTRMVIWLNVGFVISFAQLGAGEFELVRQRTLATAVGGAVAAVVARTLLPIHVIDRLRERIIGYLDAAAEAVQAWVDTCVDPMRRAAADAASVVCATQFEAIRASAATAAFERNPFPGTSAPWTGQVVALASIGDGIEGVARAAPVDIAIGEPQMAAVRVLGMAIGADLDRIRASLRPEPRATAGSTMAQAAPLSVSEQVGALVNDPTGSLPIVLAFVTLRQAVDGLNTTVDRATTATPASPT